MTHSSNRVVLIVEDDAHKLSALLEFFDVEYPKFHIKVARSVNSAAVSIEQNSFDLAVIDMSLPAYDISAGSRVGAPEGFGGEDILRLIQDDRPGAKMVVVTQLSEFSDSLLRVTKSLEQLSSELSNEFGQEYLGLVAYSGRYAKWRAELRVLIDGAFLEVN